MLKEDLSNRKYGYLTVVEWIKGKGWRCVCDCGKETYVQSNKLTTGHTTSCGCQRGGKGKLDKSLVGKRFGRLLVTEHIGYYVPNGKEHGQLYRCVCDCGNVIDVPHTSLQSGLTKSCGCLVHDILEERNTKHGYAHRNKKERLYIVWEAMNKRCNCPTNKAYKYYGAKGVKVCDEWKDYAKFRDWAYANGYDENAPLGKHTCTIDRIDPYGNYEPNNCRFADSYVQANNKRRNKKGDTDGRTFVTN